MKNSRSLESLREEVESLISRLAKVVYRIEYPRKERRSFDYVAKLEKGAILIKTITDIEDLSRDEALELKALSRALKASHIVIGRRDKWGELEDCVVYERQGVYAVSTTTFEYMIKQRELVFNINKKGGFYANINGKKLRELREAKRMSLGEVASKIGVSRKTVYEYEKQSMDVNLEAASKLIDLFGEEVVKPIDIFELEDSSSKSRDIIGSKPDEPVEEAIIREASRMGGVAAHTRKSPIDVALKTLNGRFSIVVKHKRDYKRFMLRAEEITGIASILGTRPYAIIDDTANEDIVKDLEGLGLTVIEKKSYRNLLSRSH